MILEARGLAAGYGNKTVISDVSFSLPPGQILAFLGHNGAGKSVTLRTLMGIVPPRAGTIQFHGRAIETFSVAQRVGLGLRMLPAGRGVFHDLRVDENIDVVAAYNCGADALFRPDDVYKMFPILDERRSQRAGTLSGGQQQQLALALAVIGNPRVLLLDEPSIGLSPNIVEQLFTQVRDVCRTHGMSAVVVEQNVAAAMKVADHIMIMNNGRIVFDGPPDEARRTNIWSYF
jgi:branched-chain amino acid transport system ATP-binding protein